MISGVIVVAAVNKEDVCAPASLLIIVFPLLDDENFCDSSYYM